MSVHAYLIDDDNDYSLLLKKELLDMKVITRVTHFLSGEEALVRLVDLIRNGKPQHEFPQLIILDLHLTGASGIQILDSLKHCELTKDVPVIINSASSEKSEFIDSYKKGGAAFVQKQSDNTMLQEVLRQLRTAGKI